MERILRLLVLIIVMMFSFINNAIAGYTGPTLKLPMQPGNSILCTVEAGGQIAPILLGPDDDPIDHWHTDAGYYAIDFDNRSSDDFAIAAAAGTISAMVTAGCTNQGTACYVQLDHGGGYKTLYYHLAADSIPSSFYIGKTVTQGETLGTIGNTGDSYGAHLHFSIKYNGSGYSDTDGLSGVELDGLPFVDYSAGTSYDSSNDGSTSSGSSSRSSIITTERTTVFSTYNIRNERKNECTEIKESPNFMLSTVTDSLHWWNYSGSGDPDPSSYLRDTGKYETLLVENYTGSCNGVIVYDEWGGASRAYTVQCQQWTGWRTRNGPEGAPTQSYPRDCGAPITNVYGKGGKWVQDFQDCIIVYDPKDGTCQEEEDQEESLLFVRAYPYEFAPGEMANGTWNTVVSYQFAERYERGGASKRFGYPIMGVSSANGVSYQIFQKGSRQRTFYDNGQTIKIVNSASFQSHVAGTLTLSQLATYADEEDIEIDEENDDETDADNDSWTVAEGDCNDLSNGVHPSHEELSDAVDNDCDDVIDEDLDNDGYMTEDGDCNDLSNGIYPTHPEDIDNRDNNCDGLIDNDPYPDLQVYYPPIGGWWTAKNWEGDTLVYYTNLFQGYFTQGATENWYRFPSETCDVNGDLFTDILVYSPAGEWTVIESDEDTLAPPTRLWAEGFGIDTTGTYTEAHCGDFNGDGLDDALLYSALGSFQVALSTGTSFSTPVDWCACGDQATPNDQFTLLTGDPNGDGLTDIIWMATDGSLWYVGLNQDPGFQWQLWYTTFGGEGYTPLIGDINGDGMDDIAIMSETDGHWNTVLSTGTSFAQQTIWIDQHGGTGYQPFLEDMNGDTLDDAIIFTPSNGSWSIALSTGSSFSTPSAWITDFGTDATGYYGVMPFITKTHR